MINFKDEYTIVLSRRNGEHLGQLSNIDYNTFTYVKNINNGSDEVSFEFYKTLNDYTDDLWDEVYDLRLVWIKEFDMYFEISISLDESIATKKVVTGTALCGAELSQVVLRNIEINSELDIKRDEYDEHMPTIFYRDPEEWNSDWYNEHVWNYVDAIGNVHKQYKYIVYADEDHTIVDEVATMNLRKDYIKKASFMHRILDKVPHYSIGHIDDSLKNLQRTFSVNGTSIHDFLTGECAEQFNCIFEFSNDMNRVVNAYDLYTVCNKCGYRGEYFDVCPECGSDDLYYYGEDTTILVSVENLTDEIQYTTDVGAVKNTFYLEAGDDLMTATVVNCNPNGSQYIYYFPKETLNDMSEELRNKLEEYNALYDSKYKDYDALINSWYDAIDKVTYYRSSMMPDIDTQIKITSETEAKKLTEENIGFVAISKLTSTTLASTVELAIKNYCKILVYSGFVKLTLNTITWKNNTWTGTITVTSYTDSEDVTTTPVLHISITDDYDTYINQKFLKKLQSEDENEYLYDPLGKIHKTTLDEFKESIKYYSYNKLSSFIDAIGASLTVLQQDGVSSATNPLDPNYSAYTEFYIPYYEKQQACIEELGVRQESIEEWETIRDNYQKQISDIQDLLNFKAFIGNDLYTEFCSFRREDTYSNSNYITDGYKNNQIVARARDFLDEAKRQIVKSGEHQHSISSNIYNFINILEFQPIVDYFKISNWIRFKVNDEIYRLRLISYKIDTKNETLNTDFSTLTKTADGMNDIVSLLSKTSSMSSSYGYVQKQAEEGNRAYSSVKSYESKGINGSLISIKNNDNEEVTVDNYGVTCKVYDDEIEDFSNEQLRVTHNIIAFTTDNWLSTELALGKHQYKYYDKDKDVYTTSTAYGLSANFVNAAYISGSDIIGGNIYSTNYSRKNKTGSYINLENGNFSFGGEALIYDANGLSVNGKITATSGKIGAFEIDENNSLFASLNTSSEIIGRIGMKTEFTKGGYVYIPTEKYIDKLYHYSRSSYLNNNQLKTEEEAEVLHEGAYFAFETQYDALFVQSYKKNMIMNPDGFIFYLDLDEAVQQGGKAAESKIEFNKIIQEHMGNIYGGTRITTGRLELKSNSGTYLGNLLNVYGNGYFEGGIYIGGTYDIGNIYSLITQNSIHSLKDLRVDGKIYADSSGIITTSDERMKKDFSSLDSYDSFFDELKPLSYKFKNGTSGRTHIGFKAQDVKDALKNNGLSTQDFGGYVIQNLTEEESKELGFSDLNGLIYEEFTALNTYEIQKLKRRITELENTLDRKEVISQ